MELALKQSLTCIAQVEREISASLITQHELETEVSTKEDEKNSLIKEG